MATNSCPPLVEHHTPGTRSLLQFWTPVQGLKEPSSFRGNPRQRSGEVRWNAVGRRGSLPPSRRGHVTGRQKHLLIPPDSSIAYLPGQVPFLAPSSPDQTSPLQLSLRNGNSLMDFATPSPPPPRYYGYSRKVGVIWLSVWKPRPVLTREGLTSWSSSAARAPAISTHKPQLRHRPAAGFGLQDGPSLPRLFSASVELEPLMVVESEACWEHYMRCCVKVRRKVPGRW